MLNAIILNCKFFNLSKIKRIDCAFYRCTELEKSTETNLVVSAIWVLTPQLLLSLTIWERAIHKIRSNYWKNMTECLHQDVNQRWVRFCSSLCLQYIIYIFPTLYHPFWGANFYYSSNNLIALLFSKSLFVSLSMEIIAN